MGAACFAQHTRQQAVAGTCTHMLHQMPTTVFLAALLHKCYTRRQQQCSWQRMRSRKHIQHKSVSRAVVSMLSAGALDRGTTWHEF
jgi:hypothetical protein